MRTASQEAINLYQHINATDRIKYKADFSSVNGGCLVTRVCMNANFDPYMN